MKLDPTPGDLVLWHTPDGSSVLGLIVHEETGHGGGATGWFRVFATVGGRSKKFLARAGHVEILVDNCT